MTWTHFLSFYTLSMQKKKWWQLPANTVGLHKAEMIHGDVIYLGAVCIPCTLDLVAELKLCSEGLMSGILWSLVFHVLHLPFTIQIHGFRCREHCWRGGSVHLLPSKAFLCKLRLLVYGRCILHLYRWVRSVVLGVSQGEPGLTFTLLGSRELSKVSIKSGPPAGSWWDKLGHCCYTMQRESLQPNQKYIVYNSVLFALCRHYSHTEDNRKVAGRQNGLFCVVSFLLRSWLHNSGLPFLAASGDCFQPARNAWVWSQVDRFSSCPSSPFCSRQGILESRDRHNGALSDRAGKLDLCSERTDSCSRGFHNATIYIRKWAEYFLKKKKQKKKPEEGKKPSSVYLARGRDQLCFYDFRGWSAGRGKCIAVCIHVFEFVFLIHNI